MMHVSIYIMYVCMYNFIYVCMYIYMNEWNKLSTDCVTASSVNMFKNKVDTYLRRAGYK